MYGANPGTQLKGSLLLSLVWRVAYKHWVVVFNVGLECEMKWWVMNNTSLKQLGGGTNWITQAGENSWRFSVWGMRESTEGLAGHKIFSLSCKCFSLSLSFFSLCIHLCQHVVMFSTHCVQLCYNSFMSVIVSGMTWMKSTIYKWSGKTECPRWRQERYK